jgi:hypothetical protein
MGVDTHLYLPSDVRVKDVALVAAALLGVSIHKHEFVDGSFFAEAPDHRVKVNAASFEAGFADIIVRPKPGESLAWLKLGECWSAFYAFEGGRGRRYLSARSYAINIAVFKGLARFFGGTVDFNDCDDRAVNYRAEKKGRNDPEEGAAEVNFQRRLLAVQPLDSVDMKLARKFAAYDGDDK